MKGFTCLAMLALAAPAAGDDSMSIWSFGVDRFERHFEHGDYALEAEAGWGNDDRRYVLRSEGVKSDGHDYEGELQLLYARPLAAYWDWQLGIEASLHDGSTTPGLVIGIEGDAPYRIETEARLTFNDHGDVFLHAEFERDFLLTQRLILQPRLGFLVGDHDENVATELRLRYEISRKFVPYVGVSWERIFGDEGTKVTSAVAGVSFWF